MIEIKNLPSIEELAKSVRKIKVKVPSKKTALDRELLYMRVQGATYSDVDEVGDNDLVVIEIFGESDRYNKDQVEITVGLKLYNADIEKALLGMKIGESKTIITEEEEVLFTVKSIRRKVYSELTLDKIRGEDPSINSIDEYEDRIYNDVCNKIIHEKCLALQINPIINKLLKSTKVRFNMSDIDAKLLQHINSQFLSLSDEEIIKAKRETLKEGDYAIPYLEDGISKEDFIDSLNEYELNKLFDYGVEDDLGDILKKIGFCEANGIDLSEEAYEELVNESSIQFNAPTEILKMQYPYFAFKYLLVDMNIEKILFDYLKNDYIEVVVAK